MWDNEYDGEHGLPSAPEPAAVCEESILPEQPEAEDCSSGTVPPDTDPQSETKTILVPELVSMWKYLLNSRYGNRRLSLYSFLNRLLRSGELSRIVGFTVQNNVINRAACELKEAEFWKIDRENFYAMVRVALTLQSCSSTRTWDGHLVCWCTFFRDSFDCSVEALTDDVSSYTEDLVLLDSHLVPIYTNQAVDQCAAQIWVKYGMGEALTNPRMRNAVALSKRMGLSIVYYPVYEHKDVKSILFFAEGTLITGEDRTEIQEDGTKVQVKDPEGTTVTIPANTIVINTNKVKERYAAFAIFHECIHYEIHYMFFRLQQMGSNDVRQVKTREIVVEEGKEYHDPIYFMEKQANRGAFALMMPAQHTQELIKEGCKKAAGFQNFGEKFEMAGLHMAYTLMLPHYLIRARMIQLGYIEARGALNYIGLDRIQPFAFHLDAWQESDISFVISPYAVSKIEESNPAFRELMTSEKYIYADGHVVRNEPRFVHYHEGKLRLTDRARKSVDDCCLRFVRRYVQANVGQYVFGRMFYDPRYEEQTAFYLSDLINERQLDDLDAKMEYRDHFPRSFVRAFDMLMKKNGETRESIAPKLHTTERSLHDWLYDPEHKISLDFVVGVSLMWQVPDWISKMLLDRAMIHVSEYDRRHQALEHIRTVLWDQGIDAANKYLSAKGLDPLAI